MLPKPCGPPYRRLPQESDNFGILGFAIVGVFIVSWGASYLIYRRNRYDEIEVNAEGA